MSLNRCGPFQTFNRTKIEANHMKKQNVPKQDLHLKVALVAQFIYIRNLTYKMVHNSHFIQCIKAVYTTFHMAIFVGAVCLNWFQLGRNGHND